MISSPYTIASFMLGLILLALVVTHIVHNEINSTLVPISEKNAVVTLVMGSSTGYVAGALALAQSLIDVGSKLKRVVMVTPDVDENSRSQLENHWEVIQVTEYFCNHKHHLNGSEYDLSGDKYTQGVKRWERTCTKFAAWGMTQFDRVIFMDSDMLVVGNGIDSALYEYSNSSFLAAPESFPPDNFNAGFMVLNPSQSTLQELLRLNQNIGSAEGGDQGILNNGFCPDWFLSTDNSKCGRLPWIFNVEAAHYQKYKTLRLMAGQPEPSVIHFVSDGKPWVVLMYEYLRPEERDMRVPAATRVELGNQAMVHMLWRKAFFRATGEAPSNSAYLLSLAQDGDKLHSPDTAQQVGKQGSATVTKKRRSKSSLS